MKLKLNLKHGLICVSCLKLTLPLQLLVLLLLPSNLLFDYLHHSLLIAVRFLLQKALTNTLSCVHLLKGWFSHLGLTQAVCCIHVQPIIFTTSRDIENRHSIDGA